MDEDTPLLSTGSLSDASKDMSGCDSNNYSSTMSEHNVELSSGVTVGLQCDLLQAPPLLRLSELSGLPKSVGTI